MHHLHLMSMKYCLNNLYLTLLNIYPYYYYVKKGKVNYRKKYTLSCLYKNLLNSQDFQFQNKKRLLNRMKPEFRHLLT